MLNIHKGLKGQIKFPSWLDSLSPCLAHDVNVIVPTMALLRCDFGSAPSCFIVPWYTIIMLLQNEKNS